MLKMEAVTKIYDCFTICLYKTEEPKNFEIFAPISLEVRLLCRDTGRISLDYKWLPLKLIIKITELKMRPYEL